MANFGIDPHPHLPAGFTWASRVLPYEPPPRPCVCLALSLKRTNEDLAVALFTPSVAKEDYIPMARALHQFLLDEGVRAPEIQPVPLVRRSFASPRL